MFNSTAFRIYIVALIVRLIPLLLLRSTGIGADDSFQYDMLARSLASGHGFRWYAQADLDQLTAFLDASQSLNINFDLTSVENYDPILGIPASFRAPLYPAFLAVVYFFNGMDSSRFFAARLAQAILLGAPLAVLTLFAGRRLFPNNPRASQIAAWVVAFYPLLVIYPVGLATENLFFVLLLAGFLLLLACIERPTLIHFLLSGILLGLTALTRSIILPFAVAAFCLLLYLYGKHALPAVFSFVLVIAPWVVRNSLLHHGLTSIETSMGYNLYLGYHPDGNGSFVFGPSFDLLSILDDAKRDRVGTQKALEFIKAQPERFVPLAVNRLGYFFGLEKRAIMYFYSNNLVGYIPPPILLLLFITMLLPFVAIAVTAALGMSLLRWKPEHILLGLLFALYLLPHVLILSEDRFHLAMVPYMAILAAQVWTGGLREISLRWQESRTGKGIVIFCVLCAILLVVNWGLELYRDWDKILTLLGPYGNQSYLPY